jgi:hypothetical protein
MASRMVEFSGPFMMCFHSQGMRSANAAFTAELA